MKENVLNLKYYKNEDLYSDGDVEDELLEIVNNNESYEEILKNDNRWPILYHLSKVRHNLLEWYDFDPKGSLLEIGSGCGAISGLFCEKVDRVVGIELSKRRSMINAGRNKQFDNLEIMVGNFEDIELEEKFDYVTLIGVLEYAPLYVSSDKPFENMLNKLRKNLKEDGKLIIAIENKFGMKYWAGATEDHTGKVFDGIQNYQNIDHVRTLSKPEIERLLNKVGFEKTQFFYPLPDYKMPTTVYSDDFLPKAGELRNVSYVFDRERYQFFDEELVYDQLCIDGKFSYFANSFLIIAE